MDCDSGGLPIPGKQLVDLLGGMIGQFGECEGKPRLRIDVIQFARLNERIDGGGAASAFIRSGKGPIASSYGHATQGAFGGIV